MRRRFRYEVYPNEKENGPWRVNSKRGEKRSEALIASSLTRPKRSPPAALSMTLLSSIPGYFIALDAPPTTCTLTLTQLDLTLNTTTMIQVNIA